MVKCRSYISCGIVGIASIGRLTSCECKAVQLRLPAAQLTACDCPVWCCFTGWRPPSGAAHLCACVRLCRTDGHAFTPRKCSVRKLSAIPQHEPALTTARVHAVLAAAAPLELGVVVIRTVGISVMGVCVLV